MKKLKYLFSLIFIFIFICAAGIASSISPNLDKDIGDHFHGKRWGAKISNFENLEFVRKSNEIFDVYFDSNEDLRYLGVDVYQIEYIFQDGQMISVGILIRGDDTFNRLKRAMVKKYGPAEFFEENNILSPEETFIYWQGDKSAIEVRYQKELEDGRILILRGE